MNDNFLPIPTAESWQISNPPILSMAALKASLDIFYNIGFSKILKVSNVLKSHLWNTLSSISGIEIITPSNINERGSQVSFRVSNDSEAIVMMLKDRNIICDFRKPDIVRIAPVPLYNTIDDIDIFADILADIINK